MEERNFINSINEQVHYLSFEILNAKANVVISHGMVEHPIRYKHLANYLNENNINVYVIYHIGHGKHAKVLNHMGKNEFDRCIDNIYQLIENVKENKLPTFLLGHSMGSFMSQLYITRYDNIDGLILSGSTASSFISKVGAIIASIIYAFSSNKEKPSKFMDSMAFGGYGKAIKNARTKFDWLSRDEIQVDKYINDPYCGGVCSISFYKNLTNAMAKMDRRKYINKINKKLPIYIHGGSDDPVSNMSKGLVKLYQQYQKLNVEDVSFDIYQGARHEIYNETNKDEVYKNTINFINNHI